ncbi:MAG TPA: hypothetical protein PLU38_11705 [Kiritimatiellia bacterium]|jgi:hypothetical protein|nr:hypothetical protein [Kiritimatiellia bacterium]HQQ92515.1 hypothetical protein [Kiritimatiellia bacterium]
MKKIAKEFHQQRRGNCAQSVAYAWGQKFPGGRGVEDVFAGCGAGRAPGGLCGAVHASCTLAGTAAEQSIKQSFAEKTGGHLTCKEIRAARRVPCAECVEIAAELLENHTRGL